MTLRSDPDLYVSRMLNLVLKKDKLTTEAQLKIAHIMCNKDPLTTREAREKACLVLGLTIQNDQQISDNVVLFLDSFLDHYFLQISVLCAFSQWYSYYFVVERVFDNINSLILETNETQIKNWVLWTYATHVKYIASLSFQQRHVKFLEELLIRNGISWSVSYIIRKMTEDQYAHVEQIPETIWNLLTNIAISDEYDIGTQRNSFNALGNFFSSDYFKQVSNECQQHIANSLEKAVFKQNISPDVLDDLMRALHSMVTSGHLITEETSSKLENLLQDEDQNVREYAKVIVDMINDAKDKGHKDNTPKRHCYNVKIEKVAVTRTVAINRSQETIVTPEIRFTDQRTMLGIPDNSENFNDTQANMEYEPHMWRIFDHLHILRTTVPEIRNLLRLTERNKPLAKKDINYLCEKFSPKGQHYFSPLERGEVYELIAETFCKSARNGRCPSIEVMKLLIHHLNDQMSSSNLVRTCSQTFLEMVKHNKIIPSSILENLAVVLLKTRDPEARKIILDVLAINVEKTSNNINISFDDLKKDLLAPATCLSTSYIFLRAVLTENNQLSKEMFITLCNFISLSTEENIPQDARRNCMATIAYGIKKIDQRQFLVRKLQFCLEKVFKDGHENIDSLALQALCFYCEVECITHFQPRILNVDLHCFLIKKIDNQSVEELRNITSIYLQAASRRSILSNEVLITISNLLKISSDFNIRHNVVGILEFVTKSSNTIVLPPSVLVNIEISLDDPEIIIRTMAVDIFLENWKRNSSFILKNFQKAIVTILIHKFHVNVQKSALSLLKIAVQEKKELSNELIRIVAQFLLHPDPSMMNDAADILFYQVKYYSLSQNTVDIVERTLQNQTNQRTFIRILRRCAFNQCILKEKTLLLLGNVVFDVEDESEKNIILSTLEFADRNQPLPENINDLLKCEYYIKILKNSTCQTELQYTEKKLIDMTLNGRRLSKGILNTCQQLLSISKRQSAILQMIINITAHGQTLTNDMIEILSNLISENISTNQRFLIEIFRNLIKNNQTLPNAFFIYLRNFILDTSVNTDVIYMYTLLLERNRNSFDFDIMSQVYRLLENPDNLDLELKRNISVFLKQAIESGIATPEPELLMVLLDSDNMLIQNNTIEMIHYLLKNNQCTLPIHMINRLDQMKTNKTVIKIFKEVLQLQNPPTDIEERLELICSQDMCQDIDSLKKLKRFVSHGQSLLESHFFELSHLLYSSQREEQILASEILQITASSNQCLPNEVIEIVATTVLDGTMHPNTLHILDRALQNGWKANERTITDLTSLATEMSTDETVRNIIRDILRRHNIIDYSIIEEYLLNITTDNNEQVEKLIENYQVKIPSELFPILYNELKNQPSTVTKLRIFAVFQCAVYNHQSLSIDLLNCISEDLLTENREIVATILIKTIENGEILSEHVTHAIEKASLVNSTKSILHLIRELTNQYVSFQNETIQRLIEQTEVDHETALIIEIISEYQQLPLNLICPYLEKTLSNDNASKVRSSFIVLQHQIKKYYCEELLVLMNHVTLPFTIDLDKLSSELLTIDEYINIIRSLLSIEYLNPSIFENCTTKEWSRECLCFDLLSRMKITTNQTEVFMFYDSLSKLEEFKHYGTYDEERDHILQFLIEKYHELDMNKINQVLILLQNVSFSIIESADCNWYTNLVRFYFEEEVFVQFPDLNCAQVNRTHIVDLLCDAFNNYQSIDVVNSILHSNSKLDQLIILLSFIFEHEITNEEMNNAICLCKRKETTLRNELEMKIISKKLISIWKNPYNLVKRADNLLRKLYLHWGFHNLSNILRIVQNTSKTLKDFLCCLTVINNYRISIDLLDQILHIFTTQQSNECCNDIYKLALNHCFPLSNSIELSIEQLIEEIRKFNQNNPNIMTLLEENILQDTLQAIQLMSLEESSLYKAKSSIDKWDVNDIKKWSKNVQSNCQWARSRNNLPEILAVIRRAIYLDSNYQLRHVQVMAVLLLLGSNEESRGRLAQISTGEGKTTIISIIAIIKSLQGQYVDVVTSSIVLAQRDAQEKQGLYDMFNITVSHNGDDNTIYTSGPKQCYESSIVYGDVSHFQFDVLRHEFSLLNTRGKRSFGVVIIDEVDCMLIDENNKIARLADMLPGTEYLNPILYAIWQAIKNPEVDEVSCTNLLIQQMKALLLDENSQITVPQHLRSFALTQLLAWIENAFVARDKFEFERDYTIKPDEKNINRIAPIDYSNTGIIQAHTTLSDGLQQFLQLKHGLKLTSLNITTNFLSNIGFFDRYQNKMYGLTGTLGSEDAKQLLCNVYSVDTVTIPRYKQLYHIRLPGIVAIEQKSWIQTVVQSTVEEVQRKRAVLIICETKADAKLIFTELRNKHLDLRAYLYADNMDRDQLNIVHSRMNSGDVIVATNLAGRGTDLKTGTDVEDNGGLYVCLTFLPINTRVEEQAFGRTARQGNRGTSQLVLNMKNILPRLLSYFPEINDTQFTRLEENFQDIEYLRALCRKVETHQLNKIETKDIPEIKSRDRLFRQFCELLESLRKMDDDEYKLDSVKERWGLWLKNKEYREKVKYSLIDNITEFGFRLINDPFNSLYHVVIQQLQERSTTNQLKEQMVKHIIKNQNFYEDFLKHIDNDSSLLYMEVTLMQVLMRTMNINIVLFKSCEPFPVVYKRKNANRTICLATDADLSFYALATDNAKHVLNELLADVDEDNVVVMPNTAPTEQERKLYERLNHVLSQQDSSMDYSQFELDIRRLYINGNTIIQNPFYFLSMADILIGKSHSLFVRMKRFAKNIVKLGSSKSKEQEKALECLNAAIKLDPIYSFTAYVDRAYLIIEQQKLPMYKAFALADLGKARDQINNFILPLFRSMQLNLDNNQHDYLDNGELSAQLVIKINIVQLYLSNILNVILAIQKSQKLVDLQIFHEHEKTIITLTQLERHVALESIHRNSNSTIFLQRHIHKNSENQVYKLTFHDLLAYKDIKIKDQAIDLLNLMSNDYRNVLIQFQQITGKIGTKIVQNCEKIVQNANLQIDYLDKNELLTLFHSVSDEDIKMNIRIKAKDREQYLAVIENTTSIVIINISMEKSLQFSTSTEALHYLTRNADIKIDLISLIAVDERFFHIFESMSLDNVSFSFILNKLSSTKILKIIETLNKPISIEYTDLDKEQAEKIIKTRKERDFIIGLENLSYLKTKKILRDFDPKEQDITVSFKQIDENYLPNDKPDEELNDLNQLSINKLIIINELAPVPWFSVMTIAALGTAQIIGGILLSAFTCGIGGIAGASLIAEGISDLYFAMQGAISRNISFKDYALQKAISIALSVCTIGSKVVKQSLQTAKNVSAGSTRQLAKQTWIEARKFIQTSFKTIGAEGIENIAKNSVRTACKQVAVVTAQTGAMGVLNYSADQALNDHILVEIRTEFAIYIESSMNEMTARDPEFKQIVETAIINDLFNENHQWQNQMEEIADRILHTHQEFIQSTKSCINGIMNAYFNQVPQKAGTIQNLLTLTKYGLDFINIIKDALKYTKLTQIFFHSFKNELQKLKNNIPDLAELFTREEHIDSAITRKIVDILREHGIFDKDNLLNRDFYYEDMNQNTIENIITGEQQNYSCSFAKNVQIAIQKVNFHIEPEDYTNSVNHFFSRLLTDTYQKSMHEKKLHKLLLDQLMGILQGVFIAPIKNYVVKSVIQNLSDRIERKLNTNHKTARESLECEQLQRYNDIILNEFIEDIRSGKIVINPKAKEELDKIIQKPQKNRTQLENFAISVLNDKPGSIIELGFISAMTGKKFSVIENNESCETANDNGKIRLIYTRNQKIDGDQSSSNYWQAPSNHNLLDKQDINNSLYNSIHMQCPGMFTSPEEIRTKVAEFMLANPTYAARILPSLNVLDSHSNPFLESRSSRNDRCTQINSIRVPTTLLQSKQSYINISTVSDTLKKLYNFLNDNGKEIILAIDIAYRLFPRLISQEMITFTDTVVTIIKLRDTSISPYQKKGVVRAIRELNCASIIAIKILHERDTYPSSQNQ